MTEDHQEMSTTTTTTAPSSTSSLQALLEACRRTPDSHKASGNKPQDHYQKALSPWRYKVRSALLPLIHWETPKLAELQRLVRHEVLDIYFALSANLGTHTFYMLMLPVTFWYGMTHIARDLLFVLAFGVYITGVVKDLLCLPRPLSPPLHRITMSHGAALEYGFPSTHSANAASVGLLLGTAIYRATDLSPATSALLYAMTAGLVFSVIAGRLYCGMHGFLDVVVGSAVGIVLALIRVCWGAEMDLAVTSSAYAGPLAVVVTIVTLIRIHPEPADDCPCFDDGVSFMGVVLGAWVSFWYIARYGPAEAANPVCHGCIPFDFAATGIVGCVARIVIGVSLVLLWKTYSKNVLLRLLPPVFRLAERLGIDQPRKFFMPASQYDKVRGAMPDLTLLETANISDIFSKSGRARSDSVGPQSAIDLYESQAYEEYEERKGRKSASHASDSGPKVTSSGHDHPTSPRERDNARSSLKVPEPAQVTSTVIVPRVKYDVEVVTRLIVYSGISFMSLPICTIVFGLLGI